MHTQEICHPTSPSHLTLPPYPQQVRKRALYTALAVLLLASMATHPLLHAWLFTHALNANFVYGATVAIGASQLFLVQVCRCEGVKL